MTIGYTGTTGGLGVSVLGPPSASTSAMHSPASGINAGPKKKISYVMRAEHEPAVRGFVNALAWDGATGRLYAAGADSIIRAWNVGTERVGKAAQQSTTPRNLANRFAVPMEHHADWVNDIVLCRGGYLLSASSDTTIKVWNAARGFCMSTLRTHKDYVRCIAYAPHTDRAASAGFDATVYLWDVAMLTRLTVQNNTVTTSALTGCKDSIYSLAMTPNGHMVAAGSTEKIIRIWDTRSGERAMKLRGHTDNVRALALSDDGTKCVSGSSDGTIRLWDLGAQRSICSFSPHHEGVWTLQMSSDFGTVYSAGRDLRIVRTELLDPLRPRLLFHEQAPVQRILLTEDESALWTATWNSTIRRWPLAQGRTTAHQHQQPTDDEEPDERSTTTPTTTTLDEDDDDVEDDEEDEDYEEVALVRQPDAVIPGAASIRSHVVLNDKRHVVTRDTDGHCALWDVLNGTKVRELGRCQLEDAVAQYQRRVYVPSWFAVEIKCGMLQVTLDEQDAFAAWVSAKEASLTIGPGAGSRSSAAAAATTAATASGGGGVKELNYGVQVLGGLFARWPRVTTTAQPHHPDDPSGIMVQIPSHTPILVSESSGRPILRVLAGETCGETESAQLADQLPLWVLDVVERRHVPKFNKIAFYLSPHSALGVKQPKKDRLSATEILLVRKVIEHVHDKILHAPMEGDDNMHAAAPSSAALFAAQQQQQQQQSAVMATTTAAAAAGLGDVIVAAGGDRPPDETIELYCNEQRLDPDMDLRTVRHLVWKQGGDLQLYYNVIK